MSDDAKSGISAGERRDNGREIGAGSEDGGSAGARRKNVATASHESFFVMEGE